jgi:hypothetical protein
MSELDKLESIIADDVVWGKTYYEADAVNKHIQKLKMKIETLEELIERRS